MVWTIVFIAVVYLVSIVSVDSQDFFLDQVLQYRQAFFQIPNSTENWRKYYDNCLIKPLDESWKTWIPAIEEKLLHQRLQIQQWLAERSCISQKDVQSLLHIKDKSLSIFDLNYGIRHGDMGYYEENVLHPKESSPRGVRVEHPYATVLPNEGLYQQLAPNPRQCQYAVQFAVAEGANKERYDFEVTITQHGCPAHNPLFSTHQHSNHDSTADVPLPNAQFQVLALEGNVHVLCEVQGMPAAESRSSYVYKHRCHVVIDYLFFSHIVRPRQDGTGAITNSSAGHEKPVKEDFRNSPLYHRLTIAHQFNLLSLPQVLNTVTQTACVTVLVFLHYEAFDMFSDVFPVSLGEELYRHKHCLQLSSKPDVATKSAWLSNIQRAFQHEYDDVYMKSVLARYKHISIVGASHARYLWDVIVNNYVANGAAVLIPLQQKHDGATTGNLTHDQVRLVQDMKKYLLKQCSMVESTLGLHSLDKKHMEHLMKHPHVYKVFIQSGAWDLTYNNILYPLLSEQNGMQALIDALHEVAKRKCSYFLDITVMSTVPAPMPVDSKMHRHLNEQAELGHHPPDMLKNMIKRNTYVSTCRAFRTNGAIQAWSAYMKHGVSQIEYPSADIQQLFDKLAQPYRSRAAPKGRLDYLDLVHLMLPFNEDTVDNMHFLKINHQGYRADKEPKVPEVSTLAGELFLGAVLDVLIRASD